MGKNVRFKKYVYTCHWHKAYAIFWPTVINKYKKARATIEEVPRNLLCVKFYCGILNFERECSNLILNEILYHCKN